MTAGGGSSKVAEAVPLAINKQDFPERGAAVTKKKSHAVAIAPDPPTLDCRNPCKWVAVLDALEEAVSGKTAELKIRSPRPRVSRDRMGASRL